MQLAGCPNKQMKVLMSMVMQDVLLCHISAGKIVYTIELRCDKSDELWVQATFIFSNCHWNVASAIATDDYGKWGVGMLNLAPLLTPCNLKIECSLPSVIWNTCTKKLEILNANDESLSFEISLRLDLFWKWIYLCKQTASETFSGCLYFYQNVKYREI